MRELKFRIWDNLKKEWVSNKQIWRMKTDEFGIGEIHPNTFYWKQHPDGLTYQQYTGLKDENGKEIYEGDIIEMDFYHSKCRGEVVFDFGKYMIDTKQLHPDNLRSIYPKISKILGNVFENSELLKQ